MVCSTWLRAYSLIWFDHWELDVLDSDSEVLSSGPSPTQLIGGQTHVVLEQKANSGLHDAHCSLSKAREIMTFSGAWILEERIFVSFWLGSQWNSVDLSSISQSFFEFVHMLQNIDWLVDYRFLDTHFLFSREDFGIHVSAKASAFSFACELFWTLLFGNKKLNLILLKWWAYIPYQFLSNKML